MATKTAYTFEKIPIELAGQNSRFVGGIYMDSYLYRLNQVYPFDTVVNGRKEHILDGHLDDLMGFYQGSIGDDVAEQVLRDILIKSVESSLIIPGGIWQPEIDSRSLFRFFGLRRLSRFLGKIKNSSGKGEGYVYGVHTAEREGFVIPITYRGNLIVLPSQKFAEHCYELGNPFFLDGAGI
ncbi:hypothetical protein J4218_03335 [Candidatus Pacearchaeota archaeon]|nr:hypothetical protein [Candidatus Pacearchaeota archaeon]